MGRHRKETQRVEEKRERERDRERANAAGTATRRTRRFQERLALTRKSKIVKSNFVETFVILSLSFSLSLSPFRTVSLSPSSPLAISVSTVYPLRGTVPSERRRPKFLSPRFSLRSIDPLPTLCHFRSIMFHSLASSPSPFFFFFFFNFYSGSPAVYDTISFSRSLNSARRDRA